MTDADHLMFIDLETTQGDPLHPHAAVLEIGAILTRCDPQLTEVARASLLVRPPGSVQDHERMRQEMPPVVQAMHQDNGLWAAATTDDNAWTPWEADAALAGWIDEQTDGGIVAIAGSGVAHLDRPFIKAVLPQTFSRAIYWVLDIGSVRRTLTLAGRRELINYERDVEAKPHRALGDAELHVAEARAYFELMRSIPAPTAN